MDDQQERTAGRYGTGERRYESPPLLVFVALSVGGLLLGNLISGVYGPGGLEVSTGGFWTAAAMIVIWLISLPLAQYLLMRRAGARPRLSWRWVQPNVFLLLRAVGHPFSRRTFILLCALPIFTAWVLFPVLAALVPGGWQGTAPFLGAAMGVSLYYFWYLIPALLRPGGTVVRELEEPGVVEFSESTPGARG